MESLVQLFSSTLGQYVSEEVVVFIISMCPFLELRGGLLAASLLKVPILKAIPISIIGNIIPIPFILFFIRAIFAWMKKFKVFRGLIERLEKRAMSKSGKVTQYEFMGLVLFVGIPLPGTGAWTGTLAASLLDMKFKDTVIAVTLGVLLAGCIMMAGSLGLFSALFSFIK